MWRPTRIDDFERAVVEGVLEERHGFDAKRQLPGSGKELAKDIAAMTTDGGSLVYGVGEDADGRPVLLAPIDLGGAAERIDQGDPALHQRLAAGRVRASAPAR